MAPCHPELVEGELVEGELVEGYLAEGGLITRTTQHQCANILDCHLEFYFAFYMKTGHQYWVYIVRCSDDKLYTGVTNNLNLRIEQHNCGMNKSCFTFCRRPVFLEYSRYFTEIKSAIAFEKQIKGWSRKKKEALIKGD